MIGIVLMALVLIAGGIIAWFIFLPLISLISTQMAGISRDIGAMIKEKTNDTNITSAVDSFTQGLDFQATAFLWLAQYGWIVISIAFFLGVFMAVRRWIEFERGGRVL